MTGPVTIVASLRPDLLAYVFHALRRQAEWYRRNGMNPPSGVDQLVDVLASRANEGQPGTTLAAFTPTGEVERMAPRLVRYETAAELLDCSVRQVKRLIADQHLPQVAVGGLKRVRVVDIDTYINHQAGAASRQGDL